MCLLQRVYRKGDEALSILPFSLFAPFAAHCSLYFSPFSNAPFSPCHSLHLAPDAFHHPAANRCSGFSPMIAAGNLNKKLNSKYPFIYFLNIPLKFQINKPAVMLTLLKPIFINFFYNKQYIQYHYISHKKFDGAIHFNSLLPNNDKYSQHIEQCCILKCLYSFYLYKH